MCNIGAIEAIRCPKCDNLLLRKSITINRVIDHIVNCDLVDVVQDDDNNDEFILVECLGCHVYAKCSVA